MESTEEAFVTSSKQKMPAVFWLYTLFTAASIAGYAHFQLIAYHFKVTAIMPDSQIPVLFAIAMGVDAMVALIAGRFYDKKGLLTLSAIPLLSIPLPFLAFSQVYYQAVLGTVLWGAVMGIQETTMRAAVAEIPTLSVATFY